MKKKIKKPRKNQKAKKQKKIKKPPKNKKPPKIDKKVKSSKVPKPFPPILGLESLGLLASPKSTRIEVWRA